jgi:hypothetical protein
VISDGYQWRRWESNPKRSDTLTLRGHSVFSRIAVNGMQPDLLLTYPAVPWNPPACPALWSLFGHRQFRVWGNVIALAFEGAAVGGTRGHAVCSAPQVTVANASSLLSVGR